MNRTIRQMLAAALIPAAALLFATTSAHAAGMTSKHAENGVACATCHKSSADGKGAAFAAPDASTCLGCHKQDAIVKASTANEWRLSEIRVEKSSLDNIFAELTKKAQK